MHSNLGPIEKHKNEIEKRISQLEDKLKEKEGNRGGYKKYRELAQDQNKIHAAQNNHISKTVEVRGKIKSQAQPARLLKEIACSPSYLQPLSETGPVRNMRELRNSAIAGEKDQKIKELYDMMKKILQGQKNIQKELNELKKQNKESARKNKMQGQTSFMQEVTPLEDSLEKAFLSKEKLLDKSNKKEIHSNNQSLLIRQQQEKKENKPVKQSKSKTKKECDFEASIMELRGQCRSGQRICVGEEWKGRVWAEVQGRVKQSEKQYKDTIHRNNKHEFDHLINTFELQRKLKDDLLDKIYQQCNPLIYK